MPCFVQTFDYLADLKSKRSLFSEHLAWITYTSPSLVAAGWIREYLRKSVLGDRKEWVTAIGSILDDQEEGDRRTFWETWLRQYVELRLDSEVPIEDDEWRAVINWSLRLVDVLPEVVALLMGRPAPQGIRDVFYYRLHKQESLLQQPEALVDLLLYVLSGEERLYHDCTYVIEIADRLLGTNVSRRKLRDLAERLGELGCSEAQEFAARVDRT